jgi:hypothetical protein
MPHEPWEWCRSFWPTSSGCGGLGLVDDGELLTQATPTAEPVDVETGPGTPSDRSRFDDPAPAQP